MIRSWPFNTRTDQALSLVLFSVLAMMVGCDSSLDSLDPSAPLGPDPHSFANYDHVRIEHVELDLATDFSRRVLAGHATLRLATMPSSAVDQPQRLVLDTWQLDIRDVNRVDGDGQRTPLSWRLGAEAIGQDQAPRSYLGQPLIIALDSDTQAIRIDYATSPDAFGLQWLTADQTRSGQPFLFSQSQPTYARTWVPLQDTPAVRYTFDARVTVPSNLMAVMGAGGNPVAIDPTGVYTFSMPQPIPSYLMAIAVGELSFESTGPRSGVYAEPDGLDAAVAEFSNLEQMIEVGEGLYGPYRWERYDLLILPPSFPFGGMENPRLSFITPTVIAGDGSLTDLIAHELAHSWSGNLVTNESWRELWLNEGFTTYFEARIMEALYGVERRRMQATLDYQGLLAELSGLAPQDQLLARDLSQQDPEQAFIGIPYDKGRLFVDWLESRYGRERLDPFLRQYFDDWAFQSIGTDEFLAYLDQHLISVESGQATMQEVREWVFEPGLPSTAVVPDSDAFERVDRFRQDWLDDAIELVDIPTQRWIVSQWRHFLVGLAGQLNLDTMAELDQAFQLTKSSNVEILYLWLLRSIETQYEPGIERLALFLQEVGRNKFIRPLYQALADSQWGRDWAIAVYAQARPGYHSLTRQAAERALGIETGSNG
ncbi:MAG: M1 family metallopeptidase [Pseudomonadota bacterium]